MIALLSLTVAPSAAPCPHPIEGGRIGGVEASLGFSSGKATLTEASHEALGAVACLFAADPGLQLTIEVHTDAQGSSAYNLKMSQARADAIRKALLGLGLPRDRIAARGFGETHPIDTNTTAAGRARNRRIELWTDPRQAPPDPAPVAPAPAAPAPVRPRPAQPVDVCATIRDAWGACAGGCTIPYTPERASALARRCLAVRGETLVDGELWIVPLASGETLQFVAVPGGSRLTRR